MVSYNYNVADGFDRYSSLKRSYSESDLNVHKASDEETFGSETTRSHDDTSYTQLDSEFFEDIHQIFIETMVEKGKAELELPTDPEDCAYTDPEDCAYIDYNPDYSEYQHRHRRYSLSDLNQIKGNEFDYLIPRRAHDDMLIGKLEVKNEFLKKIDEERHEQRDEYFYDPNPVQNNSSDSDSGSDAGFLSATDALDAE